MPHASRCEKEVAILKSIQRAHQGATDALEENDALRRFESPELRCGRKIGPGTSLLRGLARQQEEHRGEDASLAGGDEGVGGAAEDLVHGRGARRGDAKLVENVARLRNARERER